MLLKYRIMLISLVTLGSFSLTCQGSSEIAPSTNSSWVMMLPSSATNIAVAVSKEGDIAVTGSLSGGSLDLDPGEDREWVNYQRKDSDDRVHYVAVYDSDGNLKWSKSWKQQDGYPKAGLAFDSRNNVYLASQYKEFCMLLGNRCLPSPPFGN